MFISRQLEQYFKVLSLCTSVKLSTLGSDGLVLENFCVLVVKHLEDFCAT